jgi:ABC-type multidrug transport system fused ATPase/permease subunit
MERIFQALLFILLMCLCSLPGLHSFIKSNLINKNFRGYRRPSYVSSALSAKKKKQLVSENVLSILADFDDEEEEEKTAKIPVPSKPVIDNKSKKSHKADNGEKIEEPQKEVEVEKTEEIKEIKERKTKLNAKIKFIEGNRPDYVMVGLEEVTVRFGDTVVVQNASFTVSSGERVGLVGRNGAGKVTIC